MDIALIPDMEKSFHDQDPTVLLAQLIFGEGRGLSMEGKLAVGYVVRNRAGYGGKYGIGFSGVILKPFAFSALNLYDPNRHKMMAPLMYESETVWDECCVAAQMVYQRDNLDTTGHAVFYFGPPLTAPPLKADGESAWGDVTFTCQIDSLHFYRESTLPTVVLA